jgi:hypothetical protein
MRYNRYRNEFNTKEKIMNYCKFCGKQLVQGEFCNCQLNTNQQQNQQLPNQYPQLNQFPNQYPQQNQFPNQYPQQNQFPNQYPQQNQFPNQYPQQNQFPNQYPQQNQFPNQYQIKRPGQQSIKICGILMIIFGALGLLLNVSTLSIANGLNMPEGLASLLGFEVFMSLFTLVIGIIGVTCASKPDKAAIIIGCGIILIIIKIIDLIWAFTLFGTIDVSVAFGVLSSVILPAFYVSGGIKLKNS